MRYQPPLEVRRVAGRVRLQFGALACGEGTTLRETADDLVARVLALVMAFPSGGIGPLPSEGPRPDLAMLEFLYELGEIAAAVVQVAQRAPQGEVIHYPADHFEVYFPPRFDQIIADQVGFLRRHLKADAPDRSRGRA